MPRTEPPFQHCFVIMSFGQAPEIEAAYEQGIKPAVEKLGFRAVRIDKTRVVGNIMEATEKGLEHAYFIVADLTGERPNCYYELGIAHAKRGKNDTILIARDGEDIHFDIRSLNVSRYRSPEELCLLLQDTIAQGILTPPGTRSYDSDDTQRGKFGGRAIDLDRGRLLTASVLGWEDCGFVGEMDLASLQLEVAPLPGARPIEGEVTFHLHRSYAPATVQPRDGFAICKVKRVAGSFTVGATIDGEKTRLELDLARLPGQPQKFYGR